MRYRQIYLTLVLAFLLGSYKGYVALWIPPVREPAQVFPYRISSLPPEDQRLLENGISIGSEKELQYLLEDYLS